MTNSRKPQSEKLATGGGRGTTAEHMSRHSSLESTAGNNEVEPESGSDGRAAIFFDCWGQKMLSILHTNKECRAPGDVAAVEFS